MKLRLPFSEKFEDQSFSRRPIIIFKFKFSRAILLLLSQRWDCSLLRVRMCHPSSHNRILRLFVVRSNSSYRAVEKILANTTHPASDFSHARSFLHLSNSRTCLFLLKAECGLCSTLNSCELGLGLCGRNLNFG